MRRDLQILTYRISRLRHYLEQGLRAIKDDIDRQLAAFDSTVETVENTRADREQTRSERLISKFADLSVDFSKKKGNFVFLYLCLCSIFVFICIYLCLSKQQPLAQSQQSAFIQISVLCRLLARLRDKNFPLAIVRFLKEFKTET